MLLVLAVTAGLVWGAATSWLQTVLPAPFAGLANAVSPWVALAFVLGACSPGVWVAAAAGVLVCSGEVTGYYATSALRGFGVRASMVMVWLGAACAGGVVFAIAGHLWQSARRLATSLLGASLLAAVFLAEGAFQFGHVLGYVADAVLFCAIGVVLLVVLPSRVPLLRGEEQGSPPATAQIRAVALAVLLLVPVIAAGVLGPLLTQFALVTAGRQ